VSALPDLHARVLELLGELSPLLPVDEFADRLLLTLQSTFRSDYISLNQVAAEPERNWSIVQPPLSADHHATFYRLALQNPLAERFLRTRDGRPLRISDISTAEQFHATDLYREFYGLLGIEFQIAFALPSDASQLLAIAMSRCEHDFSDDERDLMTLARPHLIQCYRNSLEFTEQLARVTQAAPLGPDPQALQTLGLTPAQANVLRLVATGRSSDDIAVELGISPRTVQKHLQRIYRTLAVNGRSAAAQVAWRAAGEPN
jgi:DNA-binding CsgD family transcriptional regulator